MRGRVDQKTVERQIRGRVQTTLAFRESADNLLVSLLGEAGNTVDRNDRGHTPLLSTLIGDREATTGGPHASSASLAPGRRALPTPVTEGTAIAVARVLLRATGSTRASAGRVPERPKTASATRGAMSLAVVRSLCSTPIIEESTMTATYTFDVFSSLDGYGAASAKLDRVLGQARPRVARPPPRLIRRGAADGLRGQHASVVRTDAGLQHRGIRSA